MSHSARLLIPGDEARTDSFLKPHTPYAYFMRSNLAKGGLRYAGKPYQADYFGVFDSENLVGVLTHGWMGNVQLFAPDSATIPPLVGAWRAALAQKPRNIDLFLGPPDHVKNLLSAIGITSSALRNGGPEEGLFVLSLEKMIMPPLLGKPEIVVRRARKSDTEILVSWRHDFFVEAVGASPGKMTHDQARTEIVRRVGEGDLFVLEDRGQISSFCGVGGFLPDWMNVGPVWTPPDKRNKGYSRTVTAGALSMLKEKGLSNAVLFAIRPDAQKVYRSIGFDRVGSWMFDFLIKPIDRL